jgi:hypothetical protein
MQLKTRPCAIDLIKSLGSSQGAMGRYSIDRALSNYYDIQQLPPTAVDFSIECVCCRN